MAKRGKGAKSAEEATDIALSFARKHYPFARPLRAEKAFGTWEVQIDVGLTTAKIASFVIDIETGKIVNYSVPPLEE